MIALLAAFLSGFITGWLVRKLFWPKVDRLLPAPEYWMLCPSCRQGRPRYSDVEAGDFESVECPLCGWKTDAYEAMKAAEAEAEVKP